MTHPDNAEEILNAYLEGTALRADAEELLMRLHLSEEDRAQIETSLRLADELANSAKSIQTPLGFEERLLKNLENTQAPAARANWLLEGNEMVIKPTARKPMQMGYNDVLAAEDEPPTQD